METLLIEPTDSSPKVVLDKETPLFEISGISRPENVSGFFGPVVEWLKEYAKDPLPETKFDFRFEYFNTSSIKSILVILGELKDIEEAGSSIKVLWYYNEEDESMLEAGELLEELSEAPFEYIPEEE